MFSLQGRTVASPAERLGKYELLGRLAIGGMAEIFLARAAGIEGFEKVAVLKRILPQYAQNTSFVAMFLEEARLAATLNHPNVAHVYDIGVVNGSYFFTMEYIHGEDLRSLQKALAKRKRGLPIEHALSIIVGVCAGLHYAHEKTGTDGRPLGIVHRDVSPSNVIVTFDGGVKVLDFGIAKATKKYKQTKAGTLKGKISYMSPEQTKSDPVDRRADVFSIGILLYELTTGMRLFPGDSEFAVINKIVNEDVPPPSSRAPGYPPELERIVMMALRRNPDERWQTAKEMQAAIEDFAAEHRIRISGLCLENLMQDLFGKKIEAWQAAQREGKSLTEHLAATVVRDLADPGSHSDPGSPGSGRNSPPSTGSHRAISVIGTGPNETVPLPDDVQIARPSPVKWIVLAAVILALGGIGGYVLLGAPEEPIPEPAAATGVPSTPTAAPAPAPTATPLAPTPVVTPVAPPPAPPSPPAATEPAAPAQPAATRPTPVIKKRPAKKRRNIGVSTDDSPFEAD